MEGPDHCAPVRSSVCVRVCVCDSDGASALVVSQQGVSEAGLGQRDVFAARPPPFPPSPAGSDARLEWKLSFGGRRALCRKLTHHNSLPLSWALPTHLPPARDFLDTSSLFRPRREQYTRFPAGCGFTAFPPVPVPGLIPGRPPPRPPQPPKKSIPLVQRCLLRVYCYLGIKVS